YPSSGVILARSCLGGARHVYTRQCRMAARNWKRGFEKSLAYSRQIGLLLWSQRPEVGVRLLLQNGGDSHDCRLLPEGKTDRRKVVSPRFDLRLRRFDFPWVYCFDATQAGDGRDAHAPVDRAVRCFSCAFCAAAERGPSAGYAPSETLRGLNHG